MSLLCGTARPPLPERLAFIKGAAAASGAAPPAVSYALGGTLYVSATGWLLLGVPNGLARGVYSALAEPGVELPPPDPGGAFNAHVSVMSAEEVEQVGGREKIKERGKQFRYTIGRLKEVEPAGWPDVVKVWYLTVHSPELQQLRRSYGLSSLPHRGEYDFHVTCAVRRRGVLGRGPAGVLR